MNSGASASQTGLSQAEPEVSALRASIPSAFTPASYEGKPRHLPKPEKRLLASFFEPMIERLKAMQDPELALFLRACAKVSPINCGWADYAIAKLLFDAARHIAKERLASGIEAAAAGETAETGSTEGESPVGTAETPNLNPENPDATA